MDITQLQITRHELFKNLCASAYDQIDDDAFTYMTSTLNKLTRAEGIVELFKEGLTCCMVPDFMERIEYFNDKKMPFIVVVTDVKSNEECIFAVVNGTDVAY